MRMKRFAEYLDNNNYDGILINEEIKSVTNNSIGEELIKILGAKPTTKQMDHFLNLIKSIVHCLRNNKNITRQRLENLFKDCSFDEKIDYTILSTMLNKNNNEEIND